jgi:hypothetical protein
MCGIVPIRGRHQFDAVLEAVELPSAVVRTGAGRHADQAVRRMGDYFQLLVKICSRSSVQKREEGEVKEL